MTPSRVCSVHRLQASRFQKTEVLTPVEDDVVQQRNPDYRARRLDLTGDLDVGCRGLQASCWVIVGDDNRRRSIRQRVRKHFARMDWRPIDQSDRNDPDVQDLVRSVDAGAEEVLLLAVSVVPYMNAAKDLP